MPPADGDTSDAVRPARNSPVAYTVSFSGPRATRVVGVAESRSGSVGTALASVAPHRRNDHTGDDPDQGAPLHEAFRI